MDIAGKIVPSKATLTSRLLSMAPLVDQYYDPEWLAWDSSVSAPLLALRCSGLRLLVLSIWKSYFHQLGQET